MEPETLTGLRADALADLEAGGDVLEVISTTATATDLGGRSSEASDPVEYPCLFQRANQGGSANSDPSAARSTQTEWAAYIPWDAEVPTGSVIRHSELNYTVINTNSDETNRFSLRVNLIRK